MLRRFLTALAIAAAAAGPAGPARAAPDAVTASYDVLLNGLEIAVISEHFEAQDGAYRIVSESNTVGIAALLRRQSATLTSSGRVVEAGLRPERFEGRNDGADPRSAIADFDWPGERITLTHDGTTETAALPPGTQDRVSLMYQFMYFPFGRLRQLDVPMTNGRKIDEYRYSITPDVEIDTPLGRMTTLHLVKEHAPGESATEVWLAPRYHHFPVKVLIVEKNGARYEQIITRLDLKP